MWDFNNALHNALMRAGYPLSSYAINTSIYTDSEYNDKPHLMIKNKRKHMPKSSMNEKFSEDSDPIKDMGIGIFSKHHFDTEQEALNFIWEALPTIFGGTIPSDIINADAFFSDDFLMVREYINKYVFINGNKGSFNETYDKDFRWKFHNAMHNALIRAGYKLNDKSIKSKRFSQSKYEDDPKLRIDN